MDVPKKRKKDVDKKMKLPKNLTNIVIEMGIKDLEEAEVIAQDREEWTKRSQDREEWILGVWGYGEFKEV